MSQTLTMTDMVTRLQAKTQIGVPQAACVDYLNEAFRKINQMSKGGFIWQFKQSTITVPAGAQANIAMPADFDPGKTAILKGNATASFGTTDTIIPYVSPQEFATEEHFQTTGINAFSSWTFVPSFNAPLTFAYVMRIGPKTAYPTGGGTLPFWYHSLVLPPVTDGANYFPTPDQFDSLIVDLAVQEVRNIYRMSGFGEEAQLTMQSILELVDTYRTDRFDLAGLTDQFAQAQEKAAEKAK